MAHIQPDLPYALDALEPHISAETLSFHNGKHHAGYVAKLNAAVKDTAVADVDLETLIKTETAPAIFNNAAQTFNHSFYWQCLAPNAGGTPTGAIAAAIDEKWGSFEAFKEAFTQAAATHFGSGWGWLVRDKDGTLQVTSTHDAGCPLVDGATPLLTVDVWEHAYYIDYRNARPNYLKAFWELVNWDFVNEQFAL